MFLLPSCIQLLLASCIQAQPLPPLGNSVQALHLHAIELRAAGDLPTWLPSLLAGIPQLRSLGLQSVRPCDESPVALPQLRSLTRLTYLRLAGFSGGADAPAAFPQLVGLRELILECGGAVALTAGFTALRSLSRLCLLPGVLEGEAVSVLAAMTALARLHMREPHWRTLLPLRRLPGLQYLHVEGLTASGEDATEQDVNDCLMAFSHQANGGALCLRLHGAVAFGPVFDKLAQLPARPCECRFEHYDRFSSV